MQFLIYPEEIIFMAAVIQQTRHLDHSKYDQNTIKPLTNFECARSLIAGVLISPIAICHGIVMGPLYAVKRIWGEFALRSLRNSKPSEGMSDELKAKLSKQQKHNEKYTRCLIVALCHLIPLAGVSLAAVYLKSQDPKTSNQGMAGCIEAYTHHFGKSLKNNVLNIIYPFRGMMTQDYQSPYGTVDQVISWFGPGRAKKFDIPVYRGDGKEHTISSVFLSPYMNGIHPEIPGMIMFHANMMIGHDMLYWAKSYFNMGYQILFVTMGGYPGSDEGLLTNEITSYQDANAAVEFLKNMGFTRLGVDGLSIGGTLAFAAAELHPELIKVVVANQTLNSGEKVAENQFCKGNDIKAAVHGIFTSAMPAGKIVPGVFIGKGEERRPYTTDRLDNVRKAKSLASLAEEGKQSCEVIALGTKNDEIMSYGKLTPDGYEFNSAQDIMQARYNGAKEAFMHPGEHGSTAVREIHAFEIAAILDQVLP